MGRRNRLTTAICYVLIATTTATTATAADLATGKQFTLPLADGTQARTIVLADRDGNYLLVGATPTGELLVYRLTSDIQPTPPPPPTTERCKIAIVEDPAKTTFAVRQILAAKPWREYVQNRHDFLGLLPADLIDPETNLPPPRVAAALKAAEGKTLPTVLIFNQADGLVESFPLPDTAAALLEHLQRYPGKESHASDH